MKKLMMIMALVIGLGSLANAQTKERHHKTPQQRAEIMTKKLQEKLSLTPDQTTKVNAIFIAQAAKIDSLRATKADGDKKHDRKAMRGMFKGTDEQLNAILNADQKKAYADWKAEHKEKIKSKRTEKTQG